MESDEEIPIPTIKISDFNFMNVSKYINFNETIY